MIQPTWRPESATFPVSALVPATSLTASNLRQAGGWCDPAESGACDNRWAVHQPCRGAPGPGILATWGRGNDPDPHKTIASQTMRKIETLMNKAITNGVDFKLDNTEVVSCTNVADVYLHGNLIARIGETWIELFDGGWRTATTKSRLNAILKEHGNGDYVFQKKGEWFVTFSDYRNNSVTVPFFSGMRLNW